MREILKEGKEISLRHPPQAANLISVDFIGKSTLLRALVAGVYDFVPGDGRELIVTDPSAVHTHTLCLPACLSACLPPRLSLCLCLSVSLSSCLSSLLSSFLPSFLSSFFLSFFLPF